MLSMATSDAGNMDGDVEKCLVDGVTVLGKPCKDVLKVKSETADAPKANAL